MPTCLTWNTNTQVSLEDMYKGTTRKLALQKTVICSDCNGLGGREGAVQRCPNCRGSGMQVRMQQLGPGMIQQIQSVCRDCQGQGERIDPKHRCKACAGKKVTRQKKILEVSVDKGMEDGQKITFADEGDQGRRGSMDFFGPENDPNFRQGLPITLKSCEQKWPLK